MGQKETKKLSKFELFIKRIDTYIVDVLHENDWTQLTKLLEKGTKTEKDIFNISSKLAKVIMNATQYLESLSPLMEAYESLAKQHPDSKIAKHSFEYASSYEARLLKNLTLAIDEVNELLDETKASAETIFASDVFMMSAIMPYTQYLKTKRENKSIFKPTFNNLAEVATPENILLVKSLEKRVDALVDNENKGMARFEAYINEKNNIDTVQ